MSGPVRVVVLGPIPEAVRQALRELPGGAVLSDHPRPEAAAAALGIADATLGVATFRESDVDTLRILVVREVARSERYERPLSLIRLSVDDLPQLEETYGAEPVAGYLHSLEETLRRSLRKVDLLLRTGRGDFAALLPETAGSGGGTAAERLRELTSRLLGKPPAGTTKPVLPFRATSSAGVAWTPRKDVGDAVDLIRAAEAARDRASRSGGNRVCTDEDVLP